jgi:hypothetical protein
MPSIFQLSGPVGAPYGARFIRTFQPGQYGTSVSGVGDTSYGQRFIKLYQPGQFAGLGMGTIFGASYSGALFLIALGAAGGYAARHYMKRKRK